MSDHRCPQCGSNENTATMDTFAFAVAPPRPISAPAPEPSELHTLYATHLVYECRKCGFGWFDHKGEEARDAVFLQWLRERKR